MVTATSRVEDIRSKRHTPTQGLKAFQSLAKRNLNSHFTPNGEVKLKCIINLSRMLKLDFLGGKTQEKNFFVALE